MSEYWSGFYTTDSPFKKRVRDFSSFVQSSSILYALDGKQQQF